MELKQRNYCPLCKSKEIKSFKKGTFTPKNLESTHFKITDNQYGSLWTFFKCDNCEFVLSNPYIPEKYIVNFYSQLHDQEYNEEAEGRAKNFSTILKRLKNLKPGNSLLDIGAASGIFLNMAQNEGYKIEGIEPSTSLVKEAKKQYDLNLFNGTLDNYLKDNSFKKFSVITLLDIMEHLVEPAVFFSQLDQIIDDHGFLVIVTPDINSMAAKLMGNKWWHFRIAHINFFNIKSLEFLLHQHNYEIVLKKKYVWNFSLLYLITRIFPSLKQNKPLQKLLKRLHLKLPLFDSWEIYARKKK